MSRYTAELEGSGYLNRYREGKSNSRSLDSSFSLDSSPMADMTGAAVADGKQLSYQYSASKRRFSSPGERNIFVNNSLNEDMPMIDIVRFLMSRSATANNESSEDMKHTLEEITYILQGVEDRLESNGSKGFPTLSYSPDRSKPRMSLTPNSKRSLKVDADDNLTAALGLNEPNTPTIDRMRNQDVVKLFMKNQLELNEAEAAEYENQIDRLLNELTESQNENNELRDSCNSLDEKIRIISSENEQLSQSLEWNKNSLKELQGTLKRNEAIFLEQKNEWESRQSSMEEYIQRIEMENESISRSLNAERHQRETKEKEILLLKSRCDEDVHSLESEMNEKLELRRELEEYRHNLSHCKIELQQALETRRSLETKVSNMEKRASDDRASISKLEQKCHEYEQKLENSNEEYRSHVHEKDNILKQIQAFESERAHFVESITSMNLNLQEIQGRNMFLEDENQRLSSILSEARKSIQELSDKVHKSEEHMQACQSLLNEKDQTIRQMTHKYETQITEIENLLQNEKNQVEISSHEVFEAQDIIHDYKHRIDDNAVTIMNLQQLIKDMELSRQSFDGEISRLKQELVTKNQELQRCQRSIEQFQGDSLTSQQKADKSLRDIQQQNNDLKQEISTVSSSLKKSQDDYHNLNKEFIKLKEDALKENQHWRSKFDQTNRDLMEKDDLIERMKKEYSEFVANEDLNRKKIEEKWKSHVSNEHNDLEAKCRQYQREIDAERTKINQLEREYSLKLQEYQQSLHSLEVERDDLSSKLKICMENEIAQSEESLRQYESVIDQMTNEKQMMEAQLQSVQQEASNWKASHDRLQASILDVEKISESSKSALSIMEVNGQKLQHDLDLANQRIVWMEQNLPSVDLYSMRCHEVQALGQRVEELEGLVTQFQDIFQRMGQVEQDYLSEIDSLHKTVTMYEQKIEELSKFHDKSSSSTPKSKSDEFSGALPPLPSSSKSARLLFSHSKDVRVLQEQLAQFSVSPKKISSSFLSIEKSPMKSGTTSEGIALQSPFVSFTSGPFCLKETPVPVSKRPVAETPLQLNDNDDRMDVSTGSVLSVSQLQLQIISLEDDKVRLENKIRLFEHELNEKDGQLRVQVSQLESLQDQLESTRGSLESCRSQKKSMLEKLQEHERKTESLNSELQQSRNDYLNCERALQELQEWKSTHTVRGSGAVSNHNPIADQYVASNPVDLALLQTATARTFGSLPLNGNGAMGVSSGLDSNVLHPDTVALEKLQSEYDRTSERLEILVSKIADMKNVNGELRERIEQDQNEIRTLERDCDHYRRCAESLEAQLNDFLSANGAKQNSKEVDFTPIKALTQQKEEYGKLQSQFHQIWQDYREIEKENQYLRDGLINIIHSLKTMKTDQNNLYTMVNDKCAGLEMRLTRINNRPLVHLLRTSDDRLCNEMSLEIQIIKEENILLKEDLEKMTLERNMLHDELSLERRNERRTNGLLSNFGTTKGPDESFGGWSENNVEFRNGTSTVQELRREKAKLISQFSCRYGQLDQEIVGLKCKNEHLELSELKLLMEINSLREDSLRYHTLLDQHKIQSHELSSLRARLQDAESQIDSQFRKISDLTQLQSASGIHEASDSNRISCYLQNEIEEKYKVEMNLRQELNEINLKYLTVNEELKSKADSYLKEKATLTSKVTELEKAIQQSNERLDEMINQTTELSHFKENAMIERDRFEEYIKSLNERHHGEISLLNNKLQTMSSQYFKLQESIAKEQRVHGDRENTFLNDHANFTSSSETLLKLRQEYQRKELECGLLEKDRSHLEQKVKMLEEREKTWYDNRKAGFDSRAMDSEVMPGWKIEKDNLIKELNTARSLLHDEQQHARNVERTYQELEGNYDSLMKEFQQLSVHCGRLQQRITEFESNHAFYENEIENLKGQNKILENKLVSSSSTREKLEQELLRLSSLNNNRDLGHEESSRRHQSSVELVHRQFHIVIEVQQLVKSVIDSQSFKSLSFPLEEIVSGEQLRLLQSSWTWSEDLDGLVVLDYLTTLLESIKKLLKFSFRKCKSLETERKKKMETLESSVGALKPSMESQSLSQLQIENEKLRREVHGLRESLNMMPSFSPTLTNQKGLWSSFAMESSTNIKNRIAQIHSFLLSSLDTHHKITSNYLERLPLPWLNQEWLQQTIESRNTSPSQDESGDFVFSEIVLLLQEVFQEVEDSIHGLLTCERQLIFELRSQNEIFETANSTNQENVVRSTKSLERLQEDIHKKDDFINKLQLHIEEKNSSISRMHEKLALVMNQKEALEKQCQSQRENTLEIKDTLDDAQLTLRSLDNEIHELRVANESLAQENDAIMGELQQLRGKVDEMNGEMSRRSVEMMKIQSEKESLIHVKNQLEDDLSRRNTQFQTDREAFLKMEREVSLRLEADRLSTLIKSNLEGIFASWKFSWNPSITSTGPYGTDPHANDPSGNLSSMIARLQFSVDSLAVFRQFLAQELSQRRRLEEERDQFEQNFQLKSKLLDEIQSNFVENEKKQRLADMEFQRRVYQLEEQCRIDSMSMKQLDMQNQSLQQEVHLLKNKLQEERQACLREKSEGKLFRDEKQLLERWQEDWKVREERLQQELQITYQQFQESQRNLASLVEEKLQANEQIQRLNGMLIEERDKNLHAWSSLPLGMGSHNNSSSMAMPNSHQLPQAWIDRLEESHRLEKRLKDQELHFREEEHQFQRLKEQQQARIALLEKEIEDDRKRRSTMESQWETVQQDKLQLQDEVRRLQEQGLKYREDLKAERSARMELEKDMQSSRKQEHEEMKKVLTETRQRAEDIELKWNDCQSENRTLLLEKRQWKQEKESLELRCQKESELRMKLEKESLKFQSALQGAHQELQSCEHRLQELKNEGNRVKGEVSDVVFHVREMINVLRSGSPNDLASFLESPMKSRPRVSSSDEDNEDNDSIAMWSAPSNDKKTMMTTMMSTKRTKSFNENGPSQTLPVKSLTEALGIAELSSSIRSFHECLHVIRERWQQEEELQEKWKWWEKERERFQSLLTKQKESHEQEITKLQNELCRLQKRILDCNSKTQDVTVSDKRSWNDSTRNESNLRVENQLQVERQLKASVMEELKIMTEKNKTLQEEVDQYRRQVRSHRDEHTFLQVICICIYI